MQTDTCHTCMASSNKNTIRCPSSVCTPLSRSLHPGECAYPQQISQAVHAYVCAAQAGGSCCCSSLLLHAPIPNATMTVLDGSCTITAPQGRSLPQPRRRRVQRKWATLCLSILHISPCWTRHKQCSMSVSARREWYVRLASRTGHRTQHAPAADARPVDCCLFTSRALVDHQAGA
jgi:hypothetical protein